MTDQATAAPKLKPPFEYARNVVISVNVSDLERSIAWYEEALGFEVSDKLEQYGWCEMRTPIDGLYVGLGQTEEQQKGGTTPTFSVKDIHAAKRHIESHGGRFEGEPYEIEGMVKLVTFYDPDGNPWMLAQNLQTEYREPE
jgi:predicted enzyme related to lactoylglutathione lyase